uniref:non-specific serine/threonine protein kinase n=1 Tax=Anopheles atroparvus TaxID=41427 RepID=A0A182JHA5_ANOAO
MEGKTESKAPEQLLKQGAEGKLYIGSYKGKQCLVKERFEKKYRHPALDRQLTRQRIKAEQKAFQRCAAAGVVTPALYGVDLEQRKVFMEYLEKARTAKDFIDELTASAEAQESARLKSLADHIGKVVGILHKNNIVHGDLTTSNMLLDPIDSEETLPYRLVTIDFGLSHFSDNTENKGVDLYVLERAILSAHSQLPNIFGMILKTYREHNTNRCDETIAKYEEDIYSTKLLGGMIEKCLSIVRAGNVTLNSGHFEPCLSEVIYSSVNILLLSAANHHFGTFLSESLRNGKANTMEIKEIKPFST